METSELIKTIRTRLGVSQRDFARAINVAFPTVSRWEKNKTEPFSITWAFIADYCEKQGLDKKIINEIKGKGEVTFNDFGSMAKNIVKNNSKDMEYVFGLLFSGIENLQKRVEFLEKEVEKLSKEQLK